MSNLTARIAKLSPQKQELLKQKLQKNIAKQEITKIKPQKRDNHTFPLSFAQERLWFLERLEPNNSFYNQPRVLRLTGKLNFAVFQQALAEIISRHESLRSNFDVIDGKPVQTIQPTVDFEIPIIELTDVPSESLDDTIQTLAAQEANKPFNLKQDLLLRTTLLKLSDCEHIVLFTTHHIVSDDWSKGILIRELATLYRAFLLGKPSPLPKLPIQYVDYVVWQREYLQGEVLDNQLNYWRQQLGNKLPVLDLPSDYSRPTKLTYQGARETFTLSHTLTQALKILCQREGVTLFMLLLTTFKVLLHKYSHQEDIVVGTPIANRNRVEIEGSIGFFVNTLVLRTSLEDNPNFKELLQQVKQVTLGAYSNQDLPFEQLVEELKPERHLNRNPLFDVMFALQNATESALTLPGLTLSPISKESKTAKLDLNLNLFESASGLEGILEYSTDLFKPATIKRMIEHFQVLLETVVNQPEISLSELALLTETERHQLLVEWNNTQANYPRALCIHQLFEAQVEKTPNAVAVVFENQQLTYQELNIRANQLAHYLQTLGVKPEVKVGICIERSAEMVIGLLAILKAGGAYIPLDPNYPKQRLAFILEEAKVSLLLSEQRLLPLLSKYQVDVICLDDDWQKSNQYITDNPTDIVTPQNLAYLIYTSGSTGKPKGVQITHTSVVNFLTSMSQTPGLMATDILLAVTTISFDIAALEIYLPLSLGARLVLVSREVAIDANQLAQQLASSQANVMQATPATWRLLLNAQWQGNKNLKILCGGEALDRSLANQLLSRSREVWNLYGPTETTIWSAVHQVKEEVEPTKNIIPIGCPINNTQLYILDRHQQLVPVGVMGELFIGGVGLARGYFNRPDLTQEKFIPNPFLGQNGEIQDPSDRLLYKTGDLARYLPNGELEYIGRIDNQIKIRGFRIELGEIEATVAQHSAVEHCVVIVREDVPGDRRLVAYFVAKEQLDSKQLREYLKPKLPDYMIPSAWMQLDTLPLTPNGKRDRQALPIPNFTITTTNYAPPSTPQEEILVNIWQEILNIKQVGINDNFFELGGHSLLATQVVSKIRQSLSIELPLRSLFEYPTVAELAGQLKGNTFTEIPAIVPVSREDNLPLSFAQERLWFLAQLEPNNPTYNQPIALRLRGRLDVEVLKQALSEIIRRHESLRTNFTICDGKAVQVIQPQVNFEVSIVELTNSLPSDRDAAIKKLVEQEAKKPFNLKQDLLIRTTLLKLNDLEHIVLFATHHIISDGWSIGVLVREIATLYQAFIANKPSPLPELSIQYADYAVWQREYLQGEVLDHQLNYWRQQLANNPPVLNLPTDYRRPNKLTYQGARQSFILNKSLTKALKILSQGEGVTLFMTLLAAFKLLLHRYSNQNDILVGTPIANRNQTEIEGLIGFFVNTLVIRTKFNHNSSFSDLLQQVKETTLGAYTHQDLPFEQLVEELKPERHLNRNPLFDVMFALQNATESQLTLPGLTLSSIKQEHKTAKFDLNLNLFESASGLEGTIEYSTDLFEPTTITRMLGHFQVLLETIVANPQQKLWELSFLTEAERQQLLVEWNDTAREYPQDKGIHQLFAVQVEKTPHAVAVVLENQQLTYQELNTKANQLAHYLRSQGVKPGVKVGICVQRSLEMLIGLLAILKAGGAYIPLDPSFPPQRLAYMLWDSQPEVLLTQQHLLTNLATPETKIICLDTDGAIIAQQSQVNLSSPITPNDLAYIIYTSGSTGKPKGVQISHSALSNFLCSMEQNPGLTADDTLLAVTTYSFDIAALELFLPIIVGARLVIASQEIVADGEKLLATLTDSKATVMQATPATWQLLLASGWNGDHRLKVLCGGEALPPQLANQLLKRCESLWNMYGPTETTIWSAASQVKMVNGSIPIHSPIANTQLYILDRFSKLVPVGVAGELCIGGAGLSQGYLNRPDLTAERFIPHPFSSKTGERLYQTGDLARYSANGEIEYLGRIDHQVKVRGYRIELGEIEVAIATHPKVRETVVITHQDPTNFSQIVAYVIHNYQSALTITELREFLASKLPDYMIPSALVPLAAMPLTPNGKVNRQALPTPKISSNKALFVLPRNSTEETIANIYAAILQQEKIGINDNFFELGGHSLLATQVVSRIRQSLSVELPLRSLFEYPTVAALANQLQDKAITEIPEIKPVSRDRNLPLSFAQQRLWFLAQLEPNNPTYNIPEALRLQGKLNIGVLTQALEAIIERHEVLRTNFTTVADRPVQIIHPQINLELPIIDLTNLPQAKREQEVTRLAEQEALKPFALERDSLLRVTLIQLDRLEHIILFTIHHIISDGWSTGILVREIATLYQAFLEEKSSPLPELPIQYADYAVWQREYLQEEVLDRQLNYWKQKLGGKLPMLALPYRQQQPAVKTNLSVSHKFALSPELTIALKQLSRQTETTLFMLILATLNTLLYRYTEQDDIVVGADIANRNQAATEDLIGFFVNLLVLRHDLSGYPSFKELLARVKETTLSAYAHQDLPYDRLVQELRSSQQVNQKSLFQVLLVMNNVPTLELELPNLTITSIDKVDSYAKFELVLFIAETESGMVGNWKYNSDLFAADTITKLANCYQALLQNIVSQPDIRINNLNILDRVEKEQVKAEVAQGKSKFNKFLKVKPKATDLPSS